MLGMSSRVSLGSTRVSFRQHEVAVWQIQQVGDLSNHVLLVTAEHIIPAKIANIAERAEDFFYLTNANNQPITDPEICEQLTSEICKELDQHMQ